MMQEVTWAAVGLLAVTNVATWLKIIYDNKKSNGKGNGNNKNHYLIIMENKTRSLMNKQAIDAICKTINGMKEENKEDHKAIFSKMDRIFEQIK
jgi:hypothetical protein